MATKSRIKLPGSERKAMAGAKAGKTVDAGDLIEVTVRIRGRTQASPEALMKIGAQKPAERRTLSREQFAEEYGADPADFAKVEAFAHAHGLAVSAANAAQRTHPPERLRRQFERSVRRGIAPLREGRRGGIPRPHGLHLHSEGPEGYHPRRARARQPAGGEAAFPIARRRSTTAAQ